MGKGEGREAELEVELMGDARESEGVKVFEDNVAYLSTCYIAAHALNHQCH